MQEIPQREIVDYDTGCAALRRIGLRLEQVRLLPVEIMPDGRVGFYIRTRTGQLVENTPYTLASAGRHKDYLIGFLYPDGRLIPDQEVMWDLHAAEAVLPRFVVYYAPNVPMNERRRLAAYQGPHDNTPQIVVP